jgi:phospholipid/cholesterol/gamma-HCH transport system substrate-binding protein
MTALRERVGMATIGATALVALVAITLFWYLGYAQTFIEGKGREVKAEFSAVPQLQQGDPVKVDGRTEGRVRKIEDIGGGRGALVTFDVDEAAGPLYRDSAVKLRWKNLLGSAFYLEVDRGTPRSGDLGGHTIPRTQTIQQVEVDDVVSVFEGRVRQGLTTLPGELSKGLRNPDGLPSLLDAVADVSPDLSHGLRGLRGRQVDSDLREFVKGTAATVSALDAPRDDLRTLVSGASATLGTTAARDAELRQTLDQGPAVTADVRTTLARLDRTLAGADGLVTRLNRSADQVGPTLAALRPTLRSTDRLLDRARPLMRALRPTARSLAGLGASGLPVLIGLQPSLDRLEKTILPYLSRKDPETGKPTSAMIGGTAAGFGGSAGQQDSNGHHIRFPASGGASSVYLPCKTALTDPTAAQMLACESLEKALRTYMEYLPALSSTARSSR